MCMNENLSLNDTVLGPIYSVPARVDDSDNNIPCSLDSQTDNVRKYQPQCSL